MQLFEYAVIKDEKRNKDGDVVDKAAILVAPTTVLARTGQEAGIKAAKDIPEDQMEDLDRVTVLVRPFSA